MHESTTRAAYLSDAFRNSRRRAGELTPASVVRYAIFLRQFVGWLGERHPEEVSAVDIDGDYLRSWYERFESQRGRTPSRNTLRNHHCALNAFYVWLERMDHVSTNPMRKLKAAKPERRRNDYLSEDEDRRLLEAPQTPQEWIVTYLLRFTGMRVSVSSLATHDLPLGRPHGVVVAG